MASKKYFLTISLCKIPEVWKLCSSLTWARPGGGQEGKGGSKGEGRMNTLNSQIMICSEIHHKELGGQVFPYFKYVGYIAKIWHVIVIFSESFPGPTSTYITTADRPRVYCCIWA